MALRCPIILPGVDDFPYVREASLQSKVIIAKRFMECQPDRLSIDGLYVLYVKSPAHMSWPGFWRAARLTYFFAGTGAAGVSFAFACEAQEVSG